MTIRLRLANNAASFTTNTKGLKWSWLVHCLLSLYTTRGEAPDMWSLLSGTFCAERTIRIVINLESLLNLHLFTNFIQTILRCSVAITTGCTGWYLFTQSAVETVQIGTQILTATVYTWLAAVVMQTALYWIGYLLTLHLSLVSAKLLRYRIEKVLVNGTKTDHVVTLRCQINENSAY